MLEWMDEGVVREFESIAGGDRRGRQRDDAEGKGNDGNKAGPFDFIHLNLVSTQSHLNRVLADWSDRGKVIIASDSSLAWGFSREALIKLAADERNLVVLTERSDGGSGWAGSLWEQWKEKTSGSTGEEKAATSWQDVSLGGQHVQLEV
jgi:cleavage and polyadenylation specificity factor subunit 2